eukprot:4995634-Pleurochrysis_carterae.AAC.1
MLAAGCTFIWCTLASLAGTQTHSAYARAALAAESLVRPAAALPDFLSPTEVAAFSFGAVPAAYLTQRLA